MIRKKLAAMKWYSYFVIILLFILTSRAFAREKTIYLDQGWTREQRQAFYETPQGSYLIPLSWFLSLEQVNDEADHRHDDYNRHDRRHPRDYPLFADEKISANLVI